MHNARQSAVANSVLDSLCGRSGGILTCTVWQGKESGPRQQEKAVQERASLKFGCSYHAGRAQNRLGRTALW